MLVIVMNERLLSPQQVCQSCLLASQTGQPRWNRGQLLCGQVIYRSDGQQAEQYQCQMGFRIANIP